MSFKCKYCQKIFATNRKRYLHERNVHISPDRYRCLLCDRGFCSSTNLKKHQNSKTHRDLEEHGVAIKQEQPPSKKRKIKVECSNEKELEKNVQCLEDNDAIKNEPLDVKYEFEVNRFPIDNEDEHDTNKNVVFNEDIDSTEQTMEMEDLGDHLITIKNEPLETSFNADVGHLEITEVFTLKPAAWNHLGGHLSLITIENEDEAFDGDDLEITEARLG